MTWSVPRLAVAVAVLVGTAGCGSRAATGDAGGVEAGVEAGPDAEAAANRMPDAIGEAVPEARADAVTDDRVGTVGDAIAEPMHDAIAETAPDARADAAADAGTDAQTGVVVAAGTIVPLYTYPTDASWADLVTARKAHPAVRVVAIVNPNSGPGASKEAAFTTGIAKLVAADVRVIGYVATGYTARGVAAVEADIDRWKTFYPQIEGIFFDEQSNKAADVTFYKTVSQYAKAAGLSYTVGNPGTDTAEAYVGALDTMLIYESKGLPALSALGGWHAKYAPDNFGVIPYGAAFDAAFVRAARKSVGYVYIQNDDLPNPWDTLPPFFGDLLAALE